jgi:hypothetical protein
MKFINAAKFYKVKTLIMGGDITGKLLIPVVKQPDGKFLAIYSGSRHEARNEKEVEELQKQIRAGGYYPYLTDSDGMKEFQSNPAKINALFVEVMLATVQRWMQVAEERLKDTGVRVCITGGNDDLPQIEDIIKKSEFVIDAEGRVVEIDGGYELISSGWSNPTPWQTPRECSEEQLWDRIVGMLSQVKDVKSCVFNLHVPPFDSGLDTCPKLDANLKPTFSGGEIVMAPGGSTSVRKAIEEYQPLLGLHGHIHEANGFVKIGKTLCINPGSEYSEGILRGALIELDGASIKNFLLTQG